MTDTETLLRRGLTALASDITPEVPTLPSTASSRARTHRRSRRATVIGVVVGLPLVGGIAAAAGVIPDPVQAVFEDITGWNSAGDVHPEDARNVATFTLNGTEYQYWVSESVSGDRCEYMRFVRDGEPENGWKRCDQRVDEHQNDPLSLSGGSGVPDGQIEFSGRAPSDAVAVVITFFDGTTLSAPVQNDGYFVVATNDQTIVEHPDFPATSIQAFDSTGDVVATRNY